jgi:dTDP-4-amino-4,6-dideoxygalactose transaminase
MIPFINLNIEHNLIKNEIDEHLNNSIYVNNEYILGKELNIFENNFANYIQTTYCIGVGNGTDALEIAINSLSLNDTDEIITQCNTYVATCFAVSTNNKILKLVDIDKDTYQIDLNELEKNINNNTKVVIIVHLTGSCCNMDKLMTIINKYNLILIEDCSQSHGAKYNNKKLGSFGLLSTFSFYPSKNLGALGDGGAICTSNKILYEYIKKFRNNGCIEKYNHEILGRNSRLDNIQSGILNIKLKYLDQNNNKRLINANLYNKYLSNIHEIKTPKIENGCDPVYHLYMIKAYNRDKLKLYLNKNNIEVGIHYPLCISKIKFYKDMFNNSYPNSEENNNEILSLPMFPYLLEKDIIKICNVIQDFYIYDFPF